MDFFTNRYNVQLSTHSETSEDERPVYEFRAATIKERREESATAKRLDEIVENVESVDVMDSVESVLPHIKNRLISVKKGADELPELLDVENTLDVTSIIEMFWLMRNSEELGVLIRKKLLSALSGNTEESAKVAEDATEPQDKEAK